MSSIVNWDRAVKVGRGTEDDLDLAEAVLTIDRDTVGEPWKGKIVGATGNMNKLRAELRKPIGGANVLIIVGKLPQPRHVGYKRKKNTGQNIHISMNGKCSMNLDQLHEMNLAVCEAYNVLDNIREEETIGV